MGNWAYNLFVILQARPLWLGQRSSLRALGAPTPGALPMPGPLPPDGHGMKKGTWSSGSLIVSYSIKADGPNCDWQGTYEEWQANGVWNPCAPSQPVGEVTTSAYYTPDTDPLPLQTPPPAAPAPAAPAPAPAPPVQNVPVPAPVQPPPPTQAAPTGTIPVQNQNIFNPQQLFQPVPVLVPGGQPQPAPKAAPTPAPASLKTGTTVALVAGGLGIVGVAAALIAGGVFK